MDVAEETQNGGDYNAIDDTEVDEEQVGVGNDVDSVAGEDRRHRHDARDSSQGKIFVGGVSWDTTEEVFTKHFEKYGEIIDSVIMKEKHTRKPRGFGFITFSDPSVLDKVLEDEHIINDRTVEVKRTVPREEMDVKGGQKTKKIFVGGIPPSITDDELKEYFSSYGNIVEHQIMLDRSSGRSRGFGFVTFEREDVVEAIINEDKPHELGGKEVEIKKAEPKRAGGDYGSDTRDRFGGGFPAPYGYGAAPYGVGGGSRSGGGYGGRSARGYGADAAGGYGGYGRGYGAGTAAAAGSYGGYGYRGGYGGAMYGNGEYGDDGYGSPGGFGGASYGAGAGYYGASYGAGGYGSAYGGGYGNAGGGSYSGGAGKGYGGGAPGRGRYHPYGR